MSNWIPASEFNVSVDELEYPPTDSELERKCRHKWRLNHRYGKVYFGSRSERQLVDTVIGIFIGGGMSYDQASMEASAMVYHAPKVAY